MNKVEEAAVALLRRRRARDHLMDFVCYTMPEYQPAPHHRLIAEKLEDISSGRTSRLILTVPPRHGKSQLASRHFPAWFLGQHPRKQVICVTYNAEFALEFGRDVRRIVQEEEFSVIFQKLGLAADSKAANRWHVANGGSYVAAGVGGGITGRGAHLVIIDDPIKNQEDADSKLYRDKLWNWYKSVLYTRLMPGAAIVLIQTRWHDDDLVGRLLEEQERGGDQWDHFNLAAICESDNDALGREVGEALWPEWYPLQVLENIRKTLSAGEGPRAWSALYQQKPVEEEGALFRRDWIQWYEEEDIQAQLSLSRKGHGYFRCYGASDYAVTGQGGDYTVHMVVGVDPNDNIYVLDVWREQAETIDWVEKVIDLMLHYKPLMWAEESGQISRGIGPFLSKRMRERNCYVNREQYASAKDKPTRARPIIGRMSMRKVFFPRKAKWVDDFVHEMLRFPAGKTDDQIDTLSLIGRVLDQIIPGYIKPEDQTVGDFPPTTFGEFIKAHRRNRKYGISSGSVVIEG